ncbi:YnfA family protein [Hymenobacter sp. BRD128]|uniref:YnfA family protein n=1 Tax=Hymenobacter sp. BRD128 TaxID=2675878 RepID=UPI0015664768|nr:YnfA family protein [Hymenobacter sp. BRD128]QKG56148.1 YnfA family protein [Hymenobacter sp. BRD128]
MPAILKSVLLFLLAGLFEIGGGYLVWQWLRAGRPWWQGALGFGLLAAYGILPTLQTASFGRVYAAYGGLFIVLAFFWGWRVEGVVPDHFDWLGICLCLVGAACILYTPRT